MTAAATETKGFIGAGDVYISRFDPVAAAYGPYIGPFETSKFEISASADLKEQISKGRYTYGQVTAAVPIPKPVDFSVDFAQIDKTTMAMALQGDSAVVTTSIATITTHSVITAPDGWVDTGYTNISPTAFLVTDGASTPVTFVLGTDYEMNWDLGMIQALSTGAITAAETVKISGTTVANTSIVITGATDPQINARFRFDGINYVDGQPCRVDVYQAIMSSAAAFDFLASDFNKASLKGRLVTPAGQAEPFQVKLKQVTA